MAKIVDANKRFISDVLGGAASVEIPDYQRSYSWTNDELTALWDDVTRFEQRFPGQRIDEEEYFLGSLVAIRDGRRLRLLDGQQRIATLTIFLAAVRDALALHDAALAGRLHDSLIQEVTRPGRPPQYRLSLGVYDRDVFAAAVQEFPRPERAPTLSTASHKLIHNARNFFDRRVASALAGLDTSAQKVSWLERIWGVIGFNLTAVVVVGEEEDDATEVFETLNERGIGLSTIDLLRNFLLGQAASEGERQLIIDWWKEVFTVSDNPARVQAFLRHYWISRQGDVKARGLYKEIKRSLLDDFEHRRATPRPVLLAGIERHNADEIVEVGRSLVSLFVRWSMIARLESTVLEQHLFELAPEIWDRLPLGEVLGRVREVAPSDDQFEQAFAIASLSRPGYRRHVLARLEMKLREDAEADEVEPRAPALLHVEHIYPQTPATAAAAWDDHDDWVDRIGNLTLLHRRWNTAIRNGDFAAVKVPILQQSVILLNDDVKSRGVWNQEAVEERQRHLAVLAPSTWPL